MRLTDRRRILRLPLLLTTVAVSVVATGCDDVGLVVGEKGSGNLVAESRTVEPFSRVEASGAIKLDLRIDAEGSPTVTVTYDDNILDNVVTRVDGDTLVLELDGAVNLTGGADRVVAVTMQELESLEASGASEVRGEGIASSYRLDASGASRVDLQNLEAIDIEIDISGASNVDLFATGTVRGEVSGASDVSIYGEPGSALIDSSGASTVDIVE